MFTPENSDLSAPSSSDLSSANNTDTEASTATDTDDSDTATEMGESIPDDEPTSYSLDSGPDGFEDLSLRSPTLETAMGELQVTSLALGRTYSNSSSQYAESEGEAGSEYGMADSLGSLPPVPRPDSSASWVGLGTFESRPLDAGVPAAGFSPRRIAATGQRATWEDKPSFFEYLYGA